MPNAALSDATLIARCQAGDGAAWSLFTRRFGPLLHRFCYRLTRNHEDAADVAQETLLRAWRYLDRFRAGASVTTWLYRIAFRLAIDQRRRRERLKTLSLDADNAPDEDGSPSAFFDSLFDDTPGPEAACLSRLELEAGLALLSRLPSYFRAALLLQMQEYDYPEIAARTGVSIGTVRSRLHRGRKRLAKLRKEVLDAGTL